MSVQSFLTGDSAKNICFTYFGVHKVFYDMLKMIIFFNCDGTWHESVIITGIRTCMGYGIKTGIHCLLVSVRDYGM